MPWQRGEVYYGRGVSRLWTFHAYIVLNATNSTRTCERQGLHKHSTANGAGPLYLVPGTWYIGRSSSTAARLARRFSDDSLRRSRTSRLRPDVLEIDAWLHHQRGFFIAVPVHRGTPNPAHPAPAHASSLNEAHRPRRVPRSHRSRQALHNRPVESYLAKCYTGSGIKTRRLFVSIYFVEGEPM